MEPSREFLRGADSLRHDPGTDKIPTFHCNRVTAQAGAALLAHLPNLSQKACHHGHVERPKDDQPAVFQGCDIEVSKG
jgi:hypothetical protein